MYVLTAARIALHFYDRIVAADPVARFLMTVRRPVAQFASLLDHANSAWFEPQMAEGSAVRPFMDLVFGVPAASPAAFPPEERAFAERFFAAGGRARFVWPFRDVMASYTYFTHQALRAVPAGRLRLVATEALSTAPARAAIARHFGPRPGLLRPHDRHLRNERFGFVDHLARPRVAETTCICV